VSGGLAWITGASTGIGHALAARLARDGWRVAVSARNVRALEALAAAYPGRVFAHPLDVTDRDGVHAAVGAIEAAHGPVDRAVLNAGTHMPMSAATFSTETYRTLHAVNVLGVVHGLEALLPRMAERRAGQIAVVASVAGYRGLPTAAAYGATKAALINMCEALKPECDRLGVHLQLANPGFVETPLTARNRFPMPFLMPVETAADRLAAGLDSKRFEIVFPRRFAAILKLMRCLPYALYFPLVRRTTGA